MKDTDGVTALMLSARHGGSGLVQLLLKVGADPTSSDKQGKSAIHWAAANSVSSSGLVTGRWSCELVFGV